MKLFKIITIQAIVLLSVSNIFAQKYYNQINTAKEYKKAIKNDGPVVIMYSSKTCGPCKRMEPNFNKIAKEFPKIKFYKLDTSKLSSITKKNKVQSVPTTIYLKNGKEHQRDRGSMSKKEFKKSVETFLKKLKNKNNKK